MPNYASASISLDDHSIAPGGTAAGEVRVRNDGPSGHRFTLEVKGDTAQWVTISPFALSLGPAEEGVARIFLKPPRSAAVTAGPHHVEVRVRSDLDPKTQITATATIEVQPFRELSAVLSPLAAEGRRSADYTITVDNRGNAPEQATLKVGDRPNSGIAVTFEPGVVETAPGQRVQARMSLAARRGVLVGRARDRPFTIVVDPGGGTPIAVDGVLRQVPALKRAAVLAVGGVVAAVALVGGLLFATVFSSAGENPSRLVAGNAGCPGAGHLAHDGNGQIRANVVQPDNFSFIFLDNNGCHPVRWNPCEPIHYVFNQTNARPADLADARQAIDAVAQATGLQFTFDGTTTDSANRQPFQPSVYGQRWAPVLITWAHLGAGNGFTETAGGGLPIPVDGVYVTGIVDVNVDARLPGGDPVPNGFGSGVTFGRILLHELGHVVGLGHVTSIDEVMHDPVTDQTSPTSAYGIGDVVGLRLLGRGAGCLTTPAPRAVATRTPESVTGTPSDPSHGMPVNPSGGATPSTVAGH